MTDPTERETQAIRDAVNAMRSGKKSVGAIITHLIKKNYTSDEASYAMLYIMRRHAETNGKEPQ